MKGKGDQMSLKGRVFGNSVFFFYILILSWPLSSCVGVIEQKWGMLSTVSPEPIQFYGELGPDKRIVVAQLFCCWRDPLRGHTVQMNEDDVCVGIDTQKDHLFKILRKYTNYDVVPFSVIPEGVQGRKSTYETLKKYDPGASNICPEGWQVWTGEDDIPAGEITSELPFSTVEDMHEKIHPSAGPVVTVPCSKCLLGVTQVDGLGKTYDAFELRSQAAAVEQMKPHVAQALAKAHEADAVLVVYVYWWIKVPAFDKDVCATTKFCLYSADGSCIAKGITSGRSPTGEWSPKKSQSTKDFTEATRKSFLRIAEGLKKIQMSNAKDAK